MSGHWTWIGAVVMAMTAVSFGVQPGTFVDHGVAAQVSEQRGLMLTEFEGEPLVITFAMDRLGSGVRTSLLLIDPRTGETEQYFYPAEDQHNGDLFHLLLSSKGRLYATFGNTLVEFDLKKREWTYAKKDCSGLAMSFAEGPDGTIWSGTYPKSHLIALDPDTHAFKDYGSMDPDQKYPMSLEIGEDGWAYLGLGTAKANVVAFNPKTGERRQLADEAKRKVGTGVVYRGEDGVIYGHLGKDEPWWKLENGEATEVSGPDRKAQTGALEWQRSVTKLPDGRAIKDFNLGERKFVWVDAQGQSKPITFDYASEGAQIAALIDGPDGMIYGGTQHPMHFWTFDPKSGELKDLGPIRKIGGGNMPDMTVMGDKVVAASYAAGDLWVYDTDGPWTGGEGENPNPKVVASHRPYLHRPRCTFAHPDGEHVIVAGFPGYGHTSAGLLIYNMKTGEATKLMPENLMPGHSTITVRALENGDLICGTSSATHGGGKREAEQGEIYILDMDTKEVTFRMAPVPGAMEVVSLVNGWGDLIYGMARDATLFAFHPKTKKVLLTADLKEYGGMSGHGDDTLVRDPETGRLYAVLSKAIVEIRPGRTPARKVADLPVTATAGGTILDGVLYFPAGGRLWSYDLRGR